MKVRLVRHGQTEWNEMGRIQGSQDTVLNQTGRAQAEKTGRILLDSADQFIKIYTSTKKRALQTAQIISEITNKPCIPVAGLEEINLGDWEGLSWQNAKQTYPEQYLEWMDNRRYSRAHGGESFDDVLQRVLPCIRQIISENEQDVVIVTHSAVIQCILCHVTQTAFEHMEDFKIENSSITEIDSEKFGL